MQERSVCLHLAKVYPLTNHFLINRILKNYEKSKQLAKFEI